MSGHIVHILIRDRRWVRVEPMEFVLGDADLRRPEYELVEVIRCTQCPMGVPRPEDMPDYCQVDRLWRLR